MSSVIPYKGEKITPSQVRERYKIAHRPSIFRGLVLPKGTVFDKNIHKKMFPQLRAIDKMSKGLNRQLMKGRIIGAGVTLIPGGGLAEPGVWKWTQSKPATLVKKGARQSLRIFGPIGWALNAYLAYEVASDVISDIRKPKGFAVSTERVKSSKKRTPKFSRSIKSGKKTWCPKHRKYDFCNS